MPTQEPEPDGPGQLGLKRSASGRHVSLVMEPEPEPGAEPSLSSEELKDNIRMMCTQLAAEVELNDTIREKIKARNATMTKRYLAKRQSTKKSVAGPALVHDSDNTIDWLEDMERQHLVNLPDAREEIQFAWGLEFQLKKNKDPAAVLKHGEIRIPHEAWALCQRFWACELHLHHIVSTDGSKLIILVGAPFDVLVREAHEMKLPMRLQNTRGSLPFHEDKVGYFATNHGGLNEFEEGQWNPRELIDPDDSLTPIRDTKEGDMPAFYAEKKVFTSALQQRIVVNRMKRVGNVDLRMRMRYKAPAAQIKTMEQHVKKLKPVRGTQIHELLTVTGAYRPAADEVFPLNYEGKPVVQLLAMLVMADPMFAIDNKVPMKRTQKMQVMNTETMTYDEVIDALQILKEWCDPVFGAGREERFHGTLKQFFPIHDEDELGFLRQQWGNIYLLCNNITGYKPEYAGKKAFGSPENHTVTLQMPRSWHYQPIDEIRDYFGDDVGLYFAWLGMYTSALLFCSVFGIITMVFQPIYGGIDENPLTLAYSVYVGIWSVSFLERWRRREDQLRFLWGSENLTLTTQPLPQFQGVLRVNLETGKEDYVYGNKLARVAKIFCSYILIIMMMMITISSALSAMFIKVVHPPPAVGTPWQKYKWSIISAALNLFIIVTFGAIYELVAYRLNKWENHRTEQEFENALTVKNFIFQFFNNYFVLFYIVYLREIEDPIYKAKAPCEGEGGCLGELQIQLLIVFSGKTIGKQIFFTIKPFLYKTLLFMIMTFRVNKLLTTAVKLGSPIGGTLKKLLPSQASEFIEASFDGVVKEWEDAKSQEAAAEKYEEFTKEAEKKKMKDLVTSGHASDPAVHKQKLKINRSMVIGHGDEHEIQTKLLPYQGTFDDFNDRAIQFGYLVLFAPAFPLAPFFAYINNVIEIRGSGFKLCHGYQRPPWKARDSIGSWYTVLSILGFTAVVTNASMVAFVGSQMARDIGVEAGTGFADRVLVAELFWCFILFEHVVILIRFVIMAIFPSTSMMIQNARETLEYRKREEMKTKAEIEAERKSEEQFRLKMELHKAELQAMTLDDLRKKFKELDADGSNSISRIECQQMLRWIDPDMSEADKESAFAIIDPDNSGDITFKEFHAYVQRAHTLDEEVPTE